MSENKSDEQRKADQYASQKAWAKKNPEKVKEIRARHRAKNRDKIVAYNRAVREKKRDELNAKKKQWERENPDAVAMQKVRKRLREMHVSMRSSLKLQYNVSVEAYEAIKNMQGGVCLICGELRTTARAKRLCVDHHHDSGLCRGLLCYRCNAGLGYFAETPWIFERAVKYLEAFNAVSDESDWTSRVRRVLESLPPQSREEGRDESVEETEPVY